VTHRWDIECFLLKATLLKISFKKRCVKKHKAELIRVKITEPYKSNDPLLLKYQIVAKVTYRYFISNGPLLKYKFVTLKVTNCNMSRNFCSCVDYPLLSVSSIVCDFRHIFS